MKDVAGQIFQSCQALILITVTGLKDADKLLLTNGTVVKVWIDVCLLQSCENSSNLYGK